MARVNITDEDGQLIGWFDPDAATSWNEATRWDGRNRVSVNPVGSFGHQVLYRTAGGRWVLHTWSQWQGSQPQYKFISDSAAREWLILNEEEAAVAAHFGPVEPERGPNLGGRPEVGNVINVRLGGLLPRVDKWATAHRQHRAAAVRNLIAAGLDTTSRGRQLQQSYCWAQPRHEPVWALRAHDEAAPPCPVCARSLDCPRCGAIDPEDALAAQVTADLDAGRS